MTWFTEFLLRAYHEHLRGHVDPLVLLRGRVVRVVPVPGDHGQVAPLLRQRRDAGLVLVLVLLALFGVPRTFDVRRSPGRGDGVLTSPKVDAIDAVPAQASALGPRTSPDREHRRQVRGATPKHR